MLEKTVDFDDENSFEDYGIVFESLTIGAAEPQLVLIDVPFRNGSLDETDYFGDVRYKDRELTMGFLIPWWAEDQHNIYSEVLNNLNGKRKRVILSADQDWYYEGRLSVGEFKIDNGFFKFEIKATVDPYKYSDTLKRFIPDYNEGTEIVLQNDYMKSIPEFESGTAIQVIFNDNVYNFSPGLHKNSGIVLTEGKNYMTVINLGNERNIELLARPYYEEKIAPPADVELLNRPYWEERV